MEVTMNKMVKKIVILILIIFLFSDVMNAKSKKNDEKRFQIGLGILMSTSNLFGLIHSAKMAYEGDMSSVGIDKATSDKIPLNVRQTVLVANIFANMEYAFQFRILANIFIGESDIVLLPMDSSSNGRFDMFITLNGGVRFPFWIMPYIMAGANFTFSWYPGRVVDFENWRTTYGSNIAENFAWSPGMNIKIGLDIKFRLFSAGVYYVYMIKDFNEFGGKVSQVANDLANGDYTTAGAMIFGSQSRFGVSVCWYLF